jgi:hypothetical protein
MREKLDVHPRKVSLAGGVFSLENLLSNSQLLGGTQQTYSLVKVSWNVRGA